MNEMTTEEQTILDKEIRGVSGKILWQFFAGWTTLISSILFIYFSLKSSIEQGNEQQSKVDAIQDIRLEQVKHDLELQGLQIKELNEKYDLQTKK